LYRRSRSIAIVTTFLIASLLCALPATADEQSEQAGLASQSLLLDITRANTRLVTIGERGHVLISDDNGQSWNQILVPTRSQLTAVYFLDDKHGWAVGHDAVILSTNDAGETWSLQHRDKQYDDPLLDVWFKDQNNGFAIGAYGLFLSTNDGGTSWDRRQISDDDFHLNAITSLSQNELVIAAEQGHLYRSADGGYSWSELSSPYAGSFFGITAFDECTLLVYGLRGNLYRSSDKGENWQKIETGTEASLMDAIVQKNGSIHIVGLGGNILTSSDQGKNFSLKTRQDRKTLTAITETANGQLVMSGSAGITIEPGDSK
jgi:photosystem II stability/assembly factor-like uncharacterized protein